MICFVCSADVPELTYSTPAFVVARQWHGIGYTQWTICLDCAPYWKVALPMLRVPPSPVFDGCTFCQRLERSAPWFLAVRDAAGNGCHTCDDCLDNEIRPVAAAAKAAKQFAISAEAAKPAGNAGGDPARVVVASSGSVSGEPDSESLKYT